MSMRTHIAGLACALVLAGSAGAHAQNVEYRAAERVFNRSASKERTEIPLLLISAGFYNGMSTGEFGPRLFKAVKEFQGSIGVAQTGYMSGDQLTKLRIAGYAPIVAWGFAEVDHPLTTAKLFVPKKATPRQNYTKRGYAFQAYDDSISVDFSFFSASETSLEQLYARMGITNGSRRIDYKVIRPTFFAVAGGIAERGFYTRYQLARGGIVGFTTNWDTSRIYRGDRIANLMSNLFFVPLNGEEPETTQITRPPVSPAPAPPPSPSVAEAPKVEPPSTGGTGTGFFVSPKRMLTNAHVVEGCATVNVSFSARKTAGRVLARDKTNDLALVETESPSEATAKLRAGSRLGEDIAAFGFPHNGILATAGNFTRGSITATAGLGDDSSRLQISAPVQPGNSGGPLLDESGNVVGVVVAKLKVLQFAALTGDFAQNVNFAIKSSVAQTFLETNETQFEVGSAGDVIKPADLAAKAQSFSGIIECKP